MGKQLINIDKLVGIPDWWSLQRRPLCRTRAKVFFMSNKTAAVLNSGLPCRLSLSIKFTSGFLKYKIISILPSPEVSLTSPNLPNPTLISKHLGRLKKYKNIKPSVRSKSIIPNECGNLMCAAYTHGRGVCRQTR